MWSLPSATCRVGLTMKKYKIVRVGNDYVVQTDEQSVLKINSRRRAAKLVTRASDLLMTADPKSETDPAPSCQEGGKPDA